MENRIQTIVDKSVKLYLESPSVALELLLQEMVQAVEEFDPNTHEGLGGLLRIKDITKGFLSAIHPQNQNISLRVRIIKDKHSTQWGEAIISGNNGDDIRTPAEPNPNGVPIVIHDSPQGTRIRVYGDKEFVLSKVIEFISQNQEHLLDYLQDIENVKDFLYL